MLALGLLLHSGLLDTRFNDDFYGFFPEAIFLFWLGGWGGAGDDRAPPLLHWKKSPTELTQSVFSFLSIAVASFSGGWNHETAPHVLISTVALKWFFSCMPVVYLYRPRHGFCLQCNCVFFFYIITNSTVFFYVWAMNLNMPLSFCISTPLLSLNL